MHSHKIVTAPHSIAYPVYYGTYVHVKKFEQNFLGNVTFLGIRLFTMFQKFEPRFIRAA